MNVSWHRVSVTIAFMMTAIVVITAGCGSNRGPERTVRRFFRAMNEKDVNKLLACVDPRQERLFKATFRVLERATGFPLNDFFEMIPGLHQSFGSGTADDVHFSHMRIRSRKITGLTARVVVSVKATSRSRTGTSATSVQEIEFLLENFEEAGWRITGLQERIGKRSRKDDLLRIAIQRVSAG
jgi:hypothetical protein